MRAAAWYLRRAVPWTAVLGAIAVVGALLGATHRSESLSGLALPLAALLTAAAAGLVYDDAAIAVTAVTPRAGWARRSRLVAGLSVLGVGGALLLLRAGGTDRSDWILALAGLGGATLLLVLAGHRRHVARPGTPVASGVVLLGLAPLVLGLFVDLGSLYPAPGLSDAATTTWRTVTAIAWGALALHVVGLPFGRARTIR